MNEKILLISAFLFFIAALIIFFIFSHTFGRKKTSGDSTGIEAVQSAITGGEQQAERITESAARLNKESSEYAGQSIEHNRNITRSVNNSEDIIRKSGELIKEAESILSNENS